jgi:hypothetical protein
MFDSIVGNRVRYSNAIAYYYREYQSKLKLVDVNNKPKNVEEAIKLLKIERKELQ